MIDTDKLLLPITKRLLEALHIVQVDPGLSPTKEHHVTHLKLLDFKFNKHTLVEGLTESLVDWVFSQQRVQELFSEHIAEYGLTAAGTQLYRSARETVRIAAPQGQFGELLLNGFIQHLFRAVPLLRKQPIRTSDNHERFGADAIHYRGLANPCLVLGESKCYKSSYQFPSAFAESISSISTTINNFESEIKKFTVGGFLEPDLELVAKLILRNKIDGLTILPVSIIIYNETRKFSAIDKDGMLAEIIDCVKHQCAKVDDSVYSALHPCALSRMIYIIMPVWDLDGLLNDFVNAL